MKLGNIIRLLVPPLCFAALMLVYHWAYTHNHWLLGTFILPAFLFAKRLIAGSQPKYIPRSGLWDFSRAELLLSVLWIVPLCVYIAWQFYGSPRSDDSDAVHLVIGWAAASILSVLAQPLALRISQEEEERRKQVSSLPMASGAFTHVSAKWNELREWQHIPSSASTHARLVKIDGSHVVLERKDGRVARVPIVELAETDRKYLERRI